MKASDLLVRCLENEGVGFLFGLPGEETIDVMDSLVGSSMTFVETRHEQGAAFMADVHGRLTGRAGVCLSTLGPGATNLMTGVADAMLDRVPLVAVTGQAALDRMHKESHQYIDVIRMFRPITKWNAEITRPRIIPEAVRKAFKLAQTEKPGATHIDLPEDVATESIADLDEAVPLQVQLPFTPEPLIDQVNRAVDILNKARRPLILAGNGVIRGQAHEAVRTFARRLNIPVSHTFMAKGILSDHDPLSLYTIGLQMPDYASSVFAQADVIITIGYDFVEYAPCFWNPDRNKQIVHVDVSPAEVDAHYIVGVGVLGNLGLSLEQIAAGLDPFDVQWAEQERNMVTSVLDADFSVPRRWPMRPQHVIQDLRACLAPEDIVVCDVGAHKLWMARMYACERPNTCIISNGLAAMGIGLPGAIAAKLLHPDRRVVAVVGDAGFLVNVAELETAVRLQLPIVALVWRDNGYGVIRWKQMKRFKRSFGVDFGNPDFVALARSFGAAGFRVSAPDELQPVLEQALLGPGPAIVDCPVDYSELDRLSERLQKLR